MTTILLPMILGALLGSYAVFKSRPTTITIRVRRPRSQPQPGRRNSV